MVLEQQSLVKTYPCRGSEACHHMSRGKTLFDLSANFFLMVGNFMLTIVSNNLLLHGYHQRRIHSSVQGYTKHEILLK